MTRETNKTVEMIDYLPRGSSVQERLEAYSMPVTETGCQIWLASTTSKGYGQLEISRKKEYTHRLAYEVHVGPIPEGLLVCHHCDTPACINPLHLFLGTHQDNASDKVRKGRDRALRGSENRNAKLSGNDVDSIMNFLLYSSKTQAEVAEMFGVAGSQISHINTGACWGHRTGATPAHPIRLEPQ